MLRQDYILREIERMVEFCLRAIGLKREDTAEGLQKFLEENCESITGLNFQTLLDTPSARLVSLLYHPGTAKVPQLVACGAWLAEAADARLFAGEVDEARDLFLRGAEILAFMHAEHGNEDEFAPILEHMARLRPRIANFDFPDGQRARVTALLTPPPPGGR